MSVVIDNFNLIGDILDKIYSSVDAKCVLVYQVLIIQRKKEGNDKEGRNIKNFYFTSASELCEHKDLIVKYCHENNARAYVNVNLRDNKNVALTMLGTLANMLRSDNYASIRTIYDACYGQSSNNHTKKVWLIDIDVKDMGEVNKMVDFIDNQAQPLGESKVMSVVPTMSGYHILTHAFNPLDFFKVFPTYHKEDIKKDNPTLLYMCKRDAVPEYNLFLGTVQKYNEWYSKATTYDMEDAYNYISGKLGCDYTLDVFIKMKRLYDEWLNIEDAGGYELGYKYVCDHWNDELDKK